MRNIISPARQNHEPKKKINWLAIGLTVFLLIGAIGAGSAVAIYYWASYDLPDFQKITDYKPAMVTTVYARDGRILGNLYREKRFLVSLDDMPPYVPKAFLAAEDADFYSHEGVDLMAILRAAIKNLAAGGYKQGASTITQQVIKSMILSPEKSLKRKVREAILAYRLEKHLTKDEILFIYLNQIYLGASAYGVEAASQAYFGVHVDKLTIAQAAVLAGLPKAPTRYSPFHDINAATARQHYVLGRMRDQGWITKEQYEQAMSEKLTFRAMDDPSWDVGAYYLEEVRRQLIEKFGEDKVYTQGLRVYTACDIDHQRAAEKALRRGLVEASKRRGFDGPLARLKPELYPAFLKDNRISAKALENGGWAKAIVTRVSDKDVEVQFGSFAGIIDYKTMTWAAVSRYKRETPPPATAKGAARVLTPGDVVWISASGKPSGAGGYTVNLEQEPKVEGALVSIEPPSGDVVALVGGYSFGRSQFNRATQASRQPGSSFKPIVYSAAMDNGFTPSSVVLDTPYVYTDPYTGKVWKPENYEGGFLGPMILVTALAKSRNLVTIRVAEQIGIEKVVERSKALGIEGNIDPVPAISLGAYTVTPINLAQAYTAFARSDGAYVKPRLIYKILDAWGNTLIENPVQAVPAISPENAFVITTMLKEVIIRGTGTRVRPIDRPVAGKTGTSNDYNDAWFMGYTPYLLTGVYLGHDQLQSMGKTETGGTAAAPIWLYYRQAIEDRYPLQDFPQPPGVYFASVDAYTGKPTTTGETFYLPFIEGTQPGDGSATQTSPEAGSDSSEELLKQVF